MAEANQTEFTEFGKYKILSEIGQGAMGVVYKAHDPILDRHVAIKTISASLGSDDELRKRFHREAQAAARLNHPNIITVYDYGEEHGKIYIAMELLEGIDLKEMLSAGTLQGIEAQLAVMEEILAGLAFAHSKEVIHRDLKPGNIHIQNDGQIKILDFGLARLGATDMTQPGMVMGTPNYMSPEQVLGDKIDTRSDVFSVGAVFYEMLCGHKPFEAESMHGVLFQVVHKEPQPIRKWVADLPPILVQVVDKCLAKEKDQRFQDAGELKAAVEVVRHGLAAGRLHELTLDAETGRVFYEGEVLEEGGARSAPQRSWPPTPAGELAAKASRPSSRPPSSPPRERWVEGTIALDVQPDTPADSRPPASRRAPGTLSGRNRTRPGSIPRRPPPAGGSRMPLYAGIAVAAAAVAYFGVPRLLEDQGGGAGDARSVQLDQLTAALTRTQLELTRSHLEAKRFREAISSASAVLQIDPQHAEARRLMADARGKLTEIDAAAGEARSLLEGGDTDGAAEALHRLLELDPGHPVAAELSAQLDGFFRSRAEDAQRAMAASRSRASGARSTAEFTEGDRLARAASASLGQGEFAQATRGFLEARDAFERARTAIDLQLAEKKAEEEEAQLAAALPPAAVAAEPPPPRAVTPRPASRPQPTVPRETRATPEPTPAQMPVIRRALVARSTQNASGSKEGPGLSGFDDATAANPEFIGEIEFETPPAIGPGDPYTFKVFVRNVGEKRMKLRSLEVVERVDGRSEPVPARLLTEDVEVGERAQVAELTGTWGQGIDSWSLEVTLTGEKGDTSSNRLVLRK